MYLNENLKRIRLAHNLTQEEMGAIFNFSRKTVSSWENDRNEPDLKTLHRISKYFNISLDELVSSSSFIDSQKGVYRNKISLQFSKIIIVIHTIITILLYFQMLGFLDFKIISFFSIISCCIQNYIINKIRLSIAPQLIKNKIKISVFLILIFNSILGYRSLFINKYLVHNSSTVFGAIEIGRTILILITTYCCYQIINFCFCLILYKKQK